LRERGKREVCCHLVLAYIQGWCIALMRLQWLLTVSIDG
jgi:hypothetical protein